MPRVFDRRSFNLGSFTTSPEFDVPLGSIRCRLRCSRDSWPDRPGADPKEREVVRAEIQFSLDRGLTWPIGMGFGAMGGDYFTKSGALAPFSAVKKAIPDPTNPNRRYRVRIEARSRFTSQVDVDFE